MAQEAHYVSPKPPRRGMSQTFPLSSSIHPRQSSSAGTASSMSSTSPIAPITQSANTNPSTFRSGSVDSVQSRTQRPSVAASQHPSEKFRQFVAETFSPSTHIPVVGVPTSATVRIYDRRTQRWKLWNLVWCEWIITLVLCVALWGLLYGYSKGSYSLSITQKHIFNALATGISIALGLNLAGSLRCYVKILRWRLLGAHYRPLSEFELILQSERLSSIFKLLWKARNKRHRYLPSETQLLCVLWILINISAAILVAMLGLTYNLTQSPIYLTTVNGLVSIVDYSTLFSLGDSGAYTATQNFGLDGFNYGVVNGSLLQNNSASETIETTGSNSRYWFVDYNPNDTTIALATYRYVDSIANCSSPYNVTAGFYGNESSVTYLMDGRSVNQTIPDTAQAGPGGVTFISDTAITCGPRGTSIKVFQAQTDPADFGLQSAVQRAQFFVCNNWVSQVYNIPSESYDDYVMSDQVAHLVAGAIGWSGDNNNNNNVTNDTNQYQAYAADSNVGFFYTPGTTDVEQLISEFSVDVVANLDDPHNANAPRQTIRGEEPFHADYLQVTWWHAGPLLIGIPCLQLVTLLAVIAVGNRAIIKDDSYLAVSKLYKSTIDRLGDHGCMLRGHEIVHELRDPDEGAELEVIYAWKEMGRDDDGMVGHIDVFDSKSGIDCKPAFESGRFDGAPGVSKPVMDRSGISTEKKKTKKLKMD